MEQINNIMDIIDAHIHIPSSRFLPESFYKPTVDNLYSAINNYLPKISKDSINASFDNMYTDHDAQKLIYDLKKAKIKQAVILLPDFTFAFQDMNMTIQEQIERHISIIGDSPLQFYLMAGVDPRWGRDGYNLFCRYVEQKTIHGLKIYTPCGYYPNDENLIPYYELCSDLRIPIIYHTGPTSPAFEFKYSQIIHIDEIAHRYPNINIILAHGGVNNVEQAIELCAYRPNVYLDISGYMQIQSSDGSLTALRNLFQRKINHKIIFGTDWPIGGFRNDYLSILNTLIDPTKHVLENLSRSEIKLIFSDTILRLLCSP